jgi:iron-sulfur cluster repair protein YtfE (RIC family)
MWSSSRDAGTDTPAELLDRRADGADQWRALQRALYGLYAVVRLHFAKEEEVYLPVLDAGLSPEDATEMFRAMHEAAKSAHHTM